MLADPCCGSSEDAENALDRLRLRLGVTLRPVGENRVDIALQLPAQFRRRQEHANEPADETLHPRLPHFRDLHARAFQRAYRSFRRALAPKLAGLLGIIALAYFLLADFYSRLGHNDLSRRNTELARNAFDRTR